MVACKHIVSSIKSELERFLYQVFAKRKWQSVMIAMDDWKELKAQLSGQLAVENTFPAAMLPDERKLIERIRSQTNEHNRNNVTRTEAYRQMFLNYPELHWAFLAHMVSRNGGWCMTDLKGEFLPHLLNKTERKYFFQFFERANALIFQDAYPQLMLYQESQKQQRQLFYLLPAFHVSRFMKPFWDLFWEKKNAQLLTVALIVNEQNYIEKRVIQNPYFQKHVLETWKYKGQEILQLTQVLFPFVTAKPFTSFRTRLAGVTVRDFTDVEERIEVGKKLYAILFGIREVYEGTAQFAKETPHSGSRADFWEYIFSKNETNEHGKQKLVGCKLKKNVPLLYSPELEEAWLDEPVIPPQRFDWFQDLSALRAFHPFIPPNSFDMTSEFCLYLNKLELAALAKQQLGK